MKTAESSMKPWIKATGNGRLEVDESHPEWKRIFTAKIESLKKYKIIDGRLVNTETGQTVANQG